MKNYIIAAQALEEFIEVATPESVNVLCKMLDDFWKSYCETDVYFLWVIRWTRHDHAAKGAWTSLNYKLRHKIKELNLEVK